MAVDVLQFNELKRQINDYKINSGYDVCRQQVVGLQQCVTSLTTGPTAGPLGLQDGYACSANITQNVSIQGGFTTAGVTCIATGSILGSLRVCDTGTNFNCGATCVWTVPTGAKCARFQLWGAGAPAAGAVCCGWSLHGGNGAYASVIIPVKPGDQYTVCSGCAWVQQALCNGICELTDTRAFHGCASYVIGPRLQNVCAEGGEANPYNMINAVLGCNTSYNGYCILNQANSYCDVLVGAFHGGHACMCTTPPFFCQPASYSNIFCWNQSCAGIRATPSCRTYYGSTSAGVPVYGLPGHIPAFVSNVSKCMCIWSGGNHIGTSASYASLGCGWCYPNNGCIGCLQCATNGNFVGAPSAAVAAPGWGGMGSIVSSGGCSSGQTGKMGMACIQWA